MADVTNLGTGGSTLDAQYGSTGGADSNDPKWLPFAGAPYVYLPGVAGNYLSVPDEAALDVTGDIDIRCHVAMDDWTPGTAQILLAKESSSSNRSYRFYVAGTTGMLAFVRSADGSGITLYTSTAAPTVADGGPLWVRVIRAAASGTATFYTSTDGATWVQLGATVAGASGSIYASTSPVEVGTRAGGTTEPLAGKVFRAIVKSGIDGASVLDVDTSVITTGRATSLLAATSQTVSINRSTTGRKSVAVVAPVWLFGADDYMEVADNDLLDLAASDSFTVLAVHRAYATVGTNDALVAKKANSTATTAGWALTAGSSTAAQAQLQVGDGAAGATAVSGSRTSGAVSVVVAVRDAAADTLTVWLNGTAGAPVTDATTGSSANAEVLRIGRLSGAGAEYADMELYASAVWRRALTPQEVAAATDWYATRIVETPVHVSTVTGSDANDGSAAHPVATLARAAALLPFGGRVLVTAPESAPLRGGWAATGSASFSVEASDPGQPWHMFASEKHTSGWTADGGGVWHKAIAALPTNWQAIVTTLTETVGDASFTLSLDRNVATPTTPAAGECGYSGGTFYVHLPSDADPNGHVLEVTTADYGIANGGTGTLTLVNGVVRYAATYNISSLGGGPVIAVGVTAQFSYNSNFASLSGDLTATRCTAQRSTFNDGYSVYGTTTMTLTDCVGSYNDDEGCSPHVSATLHVTGGTYNHNGQSGCAAVGASTTVLSAVTMNSNGRLVGVYGGVFTWDTAAMTITGGSVFTGNAGAGINHDSSGTLALGAYTSTGNGAPDDLTPGP